LVCHCEVLAGMDDAHAMVTKPSLGQGGVDFAPIANQVKGGNPLIGLQSPLGALDDHPAAVVATHDIHCDSHKETQRGETPRCAREPSGSGCHTEHLAPLVVAARGANSV